MRPSACRVSPRPLGEPLYNRTRDSWGGSRPSEPGLGSGSGGPQLLASPEPKALTCRASLPLAGGGCFWTPGRAGSREPGPGLQPRLPGSLRLKVRVCGPAQHLSSACRQEPGPQTSHRYLTRGALCWCRGAGGCKWGSWGGAASVVRVGRQAGGLGGYDLKVSAPNFG